MSTRMFLALAFSVALLTVPAAAVTVSNVADKEITIGVDHGAKETVEKVPAGKSVTFDCPDGCGVTGPWGFSWMANGDQTIKSTGKSLVTVQG